MFNTKKIREQMLAAGTAPEKVEAYIESLADTTVMVVEQTYAVRPTTTKVRPPQDLVVMNDGSVCRRSEAIGSDADPWDTRR